MTILVSDIKDAAQEILGICDLKLIFRRLTDAVEVLSNSGDFDPLMGFVDICVLGDIVTLPREVYTPLAVNIGGNPTVGRDMFYRFHLNGLGDCRTPCDWQWEDKNLVPTYRDLTTPDKLTAEVRHEEDAGKEIRVFGYDDAGVLIRQKEAGVWKDGYRVPTIFGYSLPDSSAPIFSRITRVRKEESTGPIRLFTSTGTLLGVFDWDETNPQYRRIKLNRCADWVRIAYRKRVFEVKSLDDIIPIPSRIATLFMLRALKAYDDGDLARGAGWEATARRFVTEAQWSISPPTHSPIQVNDKVWMTDSSDTLD